MKFIVVYFSASGKTKRIAEYMSSKLKCDSYEIKPAIPYTDADLNWMDKKSRSSLEMADKSSRPKIIKENFDFSQYHTILLGFPIWWYTAPTIINTFLETYNLTNKTIILWATSGGSGLGQTKFDLSRSTRTPIVDGRIINNINAADKFINELE